jgi:hypothetical protein
MQDTLQRHVINYTGDWWWPDHMHDNNGAALTPYLWAAPNNGYGAAYPGDASPDWHAGYGGWVDLSALQYTVAGVAGAGGGDLSQTAFRDPTVWPALTGSAMTGGNEVNPFLARAANGEYYLCDGITSRKLSLPEAQTIADLGSSGTMTLASGRDPGAVPAEWEDISNGLTILKAQVRKGWSEVLGAVGVTLTDADRQAIADKVAAQIGDKLEEALANLNAARPALQP